MRALIQADLTWLVHDRLDKIVLVMEHSPCGHLVYTTNV